MVFCTDQMWHTLKRWYNNRTSMVHVYLAFTPLALTHELSQMFLIFAEL